MHFGVVRDGRPTGDAARAIASKSSLRKNFSRYSLFINLIFACF